MINKNRQQYLREYYQKNKEKLDAQMKEYRKKNRKRITEQMKISGKKWYQANKERKLNQGREWQKNNRKRAVEIVQKYVRNNKEKVADYNKRFNHTFEGRFRSIKHSAHKRGFEFAISFEEFKNIISGLCVYCGEDEKTIGIDRSDNSIGYTKDNSAPCCSMCNYMKKSYTTKEFLDHILKIYKWNNK